MNLMVGTIDDDELAVGGHPREVGLKPPVQASIVESCGEHDQRCVSERPGSGVDLVKRHERCMIRLAKGLDIGR